MEFLTFHFLWQKKGRPHPNNHRVRSGRRRAHTHLPLAHSHWEAIIWFKLSPAIQKCMFLVCPKCPENMGHIKKPRLWLNPEPFSPTCANYLPTAYIHFFVYIFFFITALCQWLNHLQRMKILFFLQAGNKKQGLLYMGGKVRYLHWFFFIFPVPLTLIYIHI